jgi:SAM-dependent methyltransferase
MPLQNHHPSERHQEFATVEQYVLHLIHKKAYLEGIRRAPGSRALDWGCNNGWGLELMRHSGMVPSGLDSDSARIDEARASYPHLAERIKLYTGGTPPFPQASFDLVVSVQVIEHVQEYEEYLIGIRTVLRKGGIAIFATPNRKLRLDDGMAPWNRHHVTEFSGAELKEKLIGTFEVVDVFGLQGEKAIYSVEYNRSKRCRDQARLNVQARHLDRFGTQGLGGILSGEPGVKDQNKMDWRSFSVDQLWYQERDLDYALDLLAICRTDV